MSMQHCYAALICFCILLNPIIKPLKTGKSSAEVAKFSNYPTVYLLAVGLCFSSCYSLQITRAEKVALIEESLVIISYCV